MNVVVLTAVVPPVQGQASFAMAGGAEVLEGMQVEERKGRVREREEKIGEDIRLCRGFLQMFASVAPLASIRDLE